MRRASIALALLAAAGGCHRAAAPGDANLADAPAASPALAPSQPAPPPPEATLAAAFAAAFPEGGLTGAGDTQVQYVPRTIAPLPGGDRVAMLADGTGVGLNSCRACRGALRITYLRRQGTGFVPLSPAVARTIAGQPAGRPPEWRLDTAGPRPVVAVIDRPEAARCDASATRLWRLDRGGVVADGGRARPAEGC